MVNLFYRSHRNDIRRFLSGAIVFVVCYAVMVGLMFTAPVAAEVNKNPGKELLAQYFEEIGKEKNIPPEILKAIGYLESEWRPFDEKTGIPRVGPGGYLGIMQVDSAGLDPQTVDRLKKDARFNIEWGADMLISKLERIAPMIGDGDRTVLENWYFAIWAYNCFDDRNNPTSPRYPKQGAYQDRIIRLMADPLYPATPVMMTPYPGIPAGTVPSKKNSYPTPAPAHYSFELTGNKTLAAAGSSGESTIPVIPAMSAAQVVELKGKERADAAARMAFNQWSHNSDTVYLSYSPECPDTMVGVLLGGTNQPPMLMTPNTELDRRVLEELKRLKPSRIILLNGTDALPDVVCNQIREAVENDVEIVREN